MNDNVENPTDAINENTFVIAKEEKTVNIVSLVNMDMNILCLNFNIYDNDFLLLKRVWYSQNKYGTANINHAILTVIETHFNTLQKYRQDIAKELDILIKDVNVYTYLSSVKEHDGNSYQLLFSNLLVYKTDSILKYEMNPMFFICNDKMNAFDNVFMYKQPEQMAGEQKD